MKRGSWWLNRGLVVVIVLLVLSGVVHAQQIYDLGGKTIKIQTRFGDFTPLGPRGMYDWYDQDTRLEAHIAAIEEMFNCKIEFVEKGEWFRSNPQLLITEVLAGDIPFHFTHLEVRDAIMYTQAIYGALMPLDNFLEPDFYNHYPESFRTDLQNPSFMFAGKTYGFESLNFTREAVGLIWNIDLFDREGLPSLYDLYESGDWTWNELAEISRQLTADTDGDGVIDRVGLVSDLERSCISIVYSFGGNFESEVDGRKIFSLDETGVEALEFLMSLYKEGIALPHMGSNQWGMRLHYVHEIQRLQDQLDDTLGLIPLPKGPGVDTHIVDIWNQWMGVIPITVPPEDVRGVIEVVRALWRVCEPYIDDLEEWERNYWFNSPGFALSSPDTKTYEIWRWMFQNARMHLPPHIYMAMRLSGWNWSDFMNSVVNLGQGVKGYFDERAQVVQAELDMILEQ